MQESHLLPRAALGGVFFVLSTIRLFSKLHLTPTALILLRVGLSLWVAASGR